MASYDGIVETLKEQLEKLKTTIKDTNKKENLSADEKTHVILKEMRDLRNGLDEPERQYVFDGLCAELSGKSQTMKTEFSNKNKYTHGDETD
ncbi:MAG: hypothetical protein ACRENE_04250 [Polyangiaceae bacterium]